MITKPCRTTFRKVALGQLKNVNIFCFAQVIILHFSADPEHFPQHCPPAYAIIGTNCFLIKRFLTPKCLTKSFLPNSNMFQWQYLHVCTIFHAARGVNIFVCFLLLTGKHITWTQNTLTTLNFFSQLDKV